MTVAAQSRNRYLDRPAPSSLADVLDTILDKGLVIDITFASPFWVLSC
jgi:gas vesicle structural protein